MGSHVITLSVAALCALNVTVSLLSWRRSRTTTDFLSASRHVGPWVNALAIGGEYISGASYLGIAMLVFLHGAQMMFFPIGYVMGYFVLMVLLAAPLRRSGMYTLQDFAMSRYNSPSLRRLSAALVVLTCWVYIVPQIFGAGLALQVLTGTDRWVGSVLLVLTVVASVMVGGMRSITRVQAMQYCIKVVAFGAPALLLAWAYAVGFGAWPSDVELSDVSPSAYERAREMIPAGPLHEMSDSALHRTYILIAALVGLGFGTLGLPHVLMRMYTTSRGRDSRRTSLLVMGLLAVFYAFPPVYALLGRVMYGGTLDADQAVTMVLTLPQAALPQGWGDALAAVVAVGAFSAFISSASGLTIAASGALHQEWLQRWVRRRRPGVRRTVCYRCSTLVIILVPFLVAQLLPHLPLTLLVGLVFTVSAATFSPYLVLGVWWKRCSTAGVWCGMVVGFTVSFGCIVFVLLQPLRTGWWYMVFAQPAPWLVPLVFGVTIVVSLATPRHIPSTTMHAMARMHTPLGMQPASWNIAHHTPPYLTTEVDTPPPRRSREPWPRPRDAHPTAPPVEKNTPS